jgi:DNA uptake protein ComE-like DNA-binding protein
MILEVPMTFRVHPALLAAALAVSMLPLNGQESQPAAAKAEQAGPKAQDPKAGAVAKDPSAVVQDPKDKSVPKKAGGKSAPKKPVAKSDPAAKAIFGRPNPNAPLTPTPSTKVPLPSRKKPPKIPYEQRVNLNGASREELMKIPAVDAATADRIIAGRPYKMSAELLTRNIVPGAHFWTIKDKVTAGKYSGPAKK